MMWIWITVSIIGYLAGFYVSGAIFSYTFKPKWDKVNLTWAMAIWPVFILMHFFYLGTLKYIEFLERNRTKRLQKNSQPVTPRIIDPR